MEVLPVDNVPFSGEVSPGWEGEIIGKGVDGELYESFNIQGSDGKILYNCSSPHILPIVPGAKRKVSTIIGNLLVAPQNNEEGSELLTAMKVLMHKSNGEISTTFLMNVMYYYGKTVGVREERQRKKSLKTTLAGQI